VLKAKRGAVLTGDHITVLIFAKDSSSVRRFKLPRTVLTLILLVLPFLVFCAVILGLHAFKNPDHAVEIAALERENRAQQKEIRSFSEGIAGLQNRIAQMKEFDAKLRVIANLENRPNPFFGVGGPFPGDLRERIRSQNSLDTFARPGRPVSILSEEESYPIKQEERQELRDLVQEVDRHLPHVPSVWPSRGWIIGDFGFRTSPLTGRPEMHEGIEISNSLGAPIVASADGLVTTVGTDPEHGRMLVLSHGHGITTRYGNLSQMGVTVGQKVRKGQLIGKIGNTGRSIGPHLYYEVRAEGMPINPRHYLSN